MAVELGVGYVSIVPETSKIAPGIKKAFGNAGDVGTKAGSKMSSALGLALKSGVATAGAAAAGTLGTALAKGFGRLSSIDQAQAKLTGLGNSAETVTAIMDDSLKSVKGTAHGLEEAATTSAMMVAAGIKPGEQLEQVLKTVGDTASIAGKSMADTGLIFGSIAARGKLQGDDMLQLMSAGVPVLQLLGDELGKTSGEVSDMVSKGQIDFETFERAMRKGVGGAALAMGDTFQGSLKNMGAALGRFGAALEGPVFAAAPSVFKAASASVDALTKGISPAAEKIGQVLTPALENVATAASERLAPHLEDVGQKIGDVALHFTEAAVDPANWQKASDVLRPFADAARDLGPSLGSLAGSFGTVTKNISVATWQAQGDVLEALTPLIENVLVPLVEKTAEFSEQNPGKVQAIAVAFLGFKALGTIVGPVKSVAKAFGTVTGSMKKAHEALKITKGAFKGAGGIGKAMETLAGGVGSKNGLVKGLAKGAGGFGKLSKAAAPLAGRLAPVGQFLSRGAAFLGPWGIALSAVATGLTLFFTKTEKGREMWSKLMDGLHGAWEWVTTTFSAVWDSLGEKISGVFQSVKDTVSGVWDSVTGAFQTVKDGAVAGWESIKEAAGQGMEWLGDQWTKITDFYSPLTGAIGSAFSTGWEIVKDLFATGWTALVAIVTGKWEEIPAILSAGWETIKGHFSEGVEAVAGSLGEFWENIKSSLSALWDTVSSALSNVWDWVVDKAKSLWDTVSSAFMAGVDAAVAWVEALPGRVMAFFVNLGVTAVDTAIDMWNRVSTSFQNGVDNAVAWVEALPGRVRGFFAGAGQWLYQAGRDIINGLWNGLKSVWTSVSNWISDKRNALSNFTSRVSGASASRIGMSSSADGSVQVFADGGLPSSARIQSPVGARGLVQWAEPETGGEAFIPLAESKRARSTMILATVANHFGMDLVGRDGRTYQPGTVNDLMPTRVGVFADGGITPEQMLDFMKGKEVNGEQAPRSLEGATYVWGGGLLSDWGDCSGTQSAPASLAAGVSVAGRKFSTASEAAWLTSHGFQSGLGSGPRYAVGLYNGGQGGGHTGGTIFFGGGSRVNIEMGGARGNGQIGGQAAGADHPQFPSRYWHPLDGSAESIESTSVDGVTVGTTSGSKEVGWGSANGLFELAKKGLLKVYDTGGLLHPGQLAVNLSGRAEQVMTAMQWDKLVAGLTDLADAVRQGNLGYQWLGERFGEHAGTIAMEVTGGALGGWTAETKLLADAEKGLAEVRRKATSESEAVKKAEENLKKVKDRTAIDLKVAAERDGKDEKKMKAAQQRATDTVRKAELQLEQARQNATGSTSKYADELKAAEQAVEAARRASVSAGFNNGANLQAFATSGTVTDYIGVAQSVVKLGKGLGPVYEGFNLITDGASTFLTAASGVKKAYDEQADANAALAGAEADLAAARDKGDTAAVAEAEDALTKARTTASTVAAAAGHAEISAAIQIAGVVIDAIKGIWDWAMKLRERFWKAHIDSFQAQSDAFEMIGKWQEMLAEQQQALTGLLINFEMTTIEAREAQRQLRLANWGVRVAEVQGVRSVASAAEKLWDYEKQQRIIAKAGYEDLSQAYDRFRWNAMGAAEGANQAVTHTREWRALAFEVFKASAEADRKRLDAQKTQVEAFKSAAETTRKLQRTQEDIQRQQELINQMTAQAGMSLKAAMVGQEIARVNKQLAEMEEWYSRVGNRVRTLGGDGIRVNSVWDRANDAYWARHNQLTEYLAKLTGGANAPVGAGELSDWRKLNEELARNNSDAAKYIASPGTASEIALDSFKLTSSLNDVDTKEIERLRKLQDLELTKQFTEALAPITDKLAGLGQISGAFDAFAQAERTDNQKLREALLNEGQVKLAAAEALRVTPVTVSNPFDIEIPEMPEPAPVTLVGNSFDVDDVMRLLERLGHKVDKSDGTHPTPSVVLLNKRKAVRS